MLRSSNKSDHSGLPAVPPPSPLEQLAAEYPEAPLREVMDSLAGAVLAAAALPACPQAAPALVLALARERLESLAERSVAARHRLVTGHARTGHAGPG